MWRVRAVTLYFNINATWNATCNAISIHCTWSQLPHQRWCHFNHTHYSYRQGLFIYSEENKKSIRSAQLSLSKSITAAQYLTGFTTISYNMSLMLILGLCSVHVHQTMSHYSSPTSIGWKSERIQFYVCVLVYGCLHVLLQYTLLTLFIWLLIQIFIDVYANKVRTLLRRLE